MTAGVAAALADARDAKDALVNPTAAQTTEADKAIEAAEKALEKAADKADDGPAAANDMRIVSYYDLDVSATAETQTGVTFALGFDLGAVQKLIMTTASRSKFKVQQSAMQTYLQHTLSGH